MRIPASWRLQLAPAADLPLLRADVTRRTTVLDLRRVVAAHARAPPDAVRLCAPHALANIAATASANTAAPRSAAAAAAECAHELDDDDATAEAIGLFAWRHRLRVALLQRSSPSSASTPSSDHTVLQLD